MAGLKEHQSIGGVIKSSPDDFVVEELPLYEPSGEGEHLYLLVRKRNMSHDELQRKVAKQFGVKKRDIGCAGRKDLNAVTTQTVSVYLPGKQVELPERIDSIEVLSSSLHANKLRLGHLRGNRFAIRVRNVQEEYFPILEDRLLDLASMGLPNAFGPQRFGNNANNHLLGLYFVLEDWDCLVKELLRGDARHQKFAALGEYKRAIDAWPFGQPTERNVLEAMCKGKTAHQACKTIDRQLRKLWVNAFQSAVFNAVLHQRQVDGTWAKIIQGDLVWNAEGGGRTFEITDADITSNDIASRLSTFGISPTGPLWGRSMRMPSGKVFELERQRLYSYGVEEHHLDQIKNYARGARRPLRVCVGDPEITNGLDDFGSFVEVRFELPAGSYATVVIDAMLNGVT